MENCSKVDLGRIKLHFQTTGTEYSFSKQVSGGEGGATNIRLFKKVNKKSEPLVCMIRKDNGLQILQKMDPPSPYQPNGKLLSKSSSASISSST